MVDRFEYKIDFELPIRKDQKNGNSVDYIVVI